VGGAAQGRTCWFMTMTGWPPMREYAIAASDDSLSRVAVAKGWRQPLKKKSQRYFFFKFYDRVSPCA